MIEAREQRDQLTKLRKECASLKTRLPSALQKKKGTTLVDSEQGQNMQEVVQALTKQIIDQEQALQAAKEEAQMLEEEKDQVLAIKEQLSELFASSQAQNDRALAAAQTEIKELKLSGFQERQRRLAAESQVEKLKHRLQSFHEKAIEVLQSESIETLNGSSINEIIAWFGKNMSLAEEEARSNDASFSEEESEGEKESAFDTPEDQATSGAVDDLSSEVDEEKQECAIS